MCFRTFKYEMIMYGVFNRSTAHIPFPKPSFSRAPPRGTRCPWSARTLPFASLGGLRRPRLWSVKTPSCFCVGALSGQPCYVAGISVCKEG